MLRTQITGIIGKPENFKDNKHFDEDCYTTGNPC